MTRFLHKSGFSFQSGGNELRGVAVLPQEEADTACILIHGWGTCRIGPQRSFVLLSDLLASRGFSVFRFDLPGRGESEGEENSVTLDDMGKSAADCMEYVRKTYGSVTRIGLVGVCSGGNTAILASTLQPADFLVLWSTFPFGADTSAAVKTGRTVHFMKVYAKKLLCPGTWKRLAAGALNFRLIFRTLFGHYRNNTHGSLKQSTDNVMECWKGYTGKALFVYGGKDPEAGDARREYREFCTVNGIDAEFADIPDASHNFYRKEWRDELFRVSLSFLSQDATKKLF